MVSDVPAGTVMPPVTHNTTFGAFHVSLPPTLPVVDTLPLSIVRALTLLLLNQDGEKPVICGLESSSMLMAAPPESPLLFPPPLLRNVSAVRMGLLCWMRRPVLAEYS